MAIALIHNPRSRLNRRSGTEFTQAASRLLGTSCLLPASHEDLLLEVKALAARNTDLIIINGGDGTVSDVLSAVYHAYPLDALPKLAILPSGNSNLIAGDVGFRERGVDMLRRIVSAPDSLCEVRRRPLLLSWPDGTHRARLGMFGGTTGFARAIDIAHSPQILKFASHGMAVLATLIATFGALAIRSHRDVWLNGGAASLTIDGVTLESDRSFLFLASGLAHLDHGIWPFWRQSSDPVQGVHFLNVAARPRRLLPAAAALLRGRAPDWLRHHADYLSGCAESVRLMSPCDFILDGEVLTPGSSGVLEITRGPVMRFLQD